MSAAPRITLVIGLPGSGKTEYGRALAAETGATLMDDPDSLDELPVDAGAGIVMTHPGFCRDAARRDVEAKLLARYPGAELARVFFENDLEACARNVLSRDDGRSVASDMLALSRIYEPDAALGPVLPVWRPELAPAPR